MRIKSQVRVRAYPELSHLVEQCRARYAQTFRGLLDAVVHIGKHGADVLALGPVADLGQCCRRGAVSLDRCTRKKRLNADPRRLAEVSTYVQNEFLPQLKALALCQSGIICNDPAADRFSFVEAHQAAFNDHGFCARADSDPTFDKECFSPKGDSFDPDIVTSANQPLRCGRSARRRCQ